MPSHFRGVFLLWAFAVAPAVRDLAAQTFQLSATDLADSAAMTRSMPRLAADVLAEYRDSNRDRFLDNVFGLQMLSGAYEDALASLIELRSALANAPPHVRAARVQYEVLARARIMEQNGQLFRDAFSEVFRETFVTLDDESAAWAARAFLVSAGAAANDLLWATPDQTGQNTVSLDAALTLLHVYKAVDAYRAFASLPPALVAEDDARRYSIQADVQVATPDGATVCALIVRPRQSSARLPALLQFTIYADSVAPLREALLAAAHGYLGVIGYTRGKVCSPDRPVPYVHDGSDAAALIDWIATQAWSDGRVGMYGGSYSGFTAWAAAKHMPPALRAIMVGAPVGPGIDVPMEGNISWNFVYQWPFYTANNRFLDNATYFDNARWNRLFREWYRSGKPYETLPEIDGTPNPIFADWIAHPDLDEYWRGMIPQGNEYTNIGIPILQTAGYFFGGPGAAVYYFLQHTKHDPGAEHYLLIGPYDHFQAQRGVVTALGDTATYFAGYVIDPAARIDILADLRYQWFDYALRGAPRPALLADRVNYQVMGGNCWRHAPSIAAMADNRFRLYLSAARSGERYTLSRTPGVVGTSIPQVVDLADRSDVNRRPVGGLMDTVIDTANAITLMSEPLTEPIEVSGLLSGHLDVIANKRDFDFSITPYELTADGEYFQLAPYTSRASYVLSLQNRHLLTPGQVEQLDFESNLRMISRRVGAGSRVVIVLSIVKNPAQQINYGTGGSVSAESIDDAVDPLSIRWLHDSYVEFPTAHVRSCHAVVR
jgi:uncharacterized protein